MARHTATFASAIKPQWSKTNQSVYSAMSARKRLPLLGEVTEPKRWKGRPNLTPATSTTKPSVPLSILTGSCYDASSASTWRETSMSLSDSIPLETINLAWSSGQRQISGSSAQIKLWLRWRDILQTCAKPFVEGNNIRAKMGFSD